MKKMVLFMVFFITINITICFAEEYPYVDKISVEEFEDQYKKEVYVGNYYFKAGNKRLYDADGEYYYCKTYFSADGENWTELNLITHNQPSIYYGNNKYVIYDNSQDAIPENKLYDGLRWNRPLYILDENMNVINQWNAKGYKQCNGFIDGYFFIRLQYGDDRDHIIYIKTADGINLIDITRDEYYDARDKIRSEYEMYTGMSCEFTNDGKMFIKNGKSYNVIEEVKKSGYMQNRSKIVFYSDPNLIEKSISLDGMNFYKIPHNSIIGSVETKKDYLFMKIENNEDEFYRIGVAQLTNNITVIYNDKILSFATPPVIENDRTLVPMRFLFEQMGAEVSWDGTTRTAVVEKESDEISFSIDNTTAIVNNVEKSMDVPARLINEKTMIPLRFLSEELGYQVEWDESTKTVTISEE